MVVGPPAQARAAVERALAMNRGPLVFFQGIHASVLWGNDLAEEALREDGLSQGAPVSGLGRSFHLTVRSCSSPLSFRSWPRAAVPDCQLTTRSCRFHWRERTFAHFAELRDRTQRNAPGTGKAAAVDYEPAFAGTLGSGHGVTRNQA
jgi:hypothetical protein